MREEDRALIDRAKQGDEAAYRVLLKKYERAVFNICLRMVRNREEAEDLAQEAFTKVFAMLDRYNPAFAFSNWLFKITSNLCIDSIRKRRIDTLPMDAPVEGEKGTYARQYQSPDDDPETLLVTGQRMKLLSDAVDNLPPHYRVMILLRHQENLSYEEIAECLEVPLGTVKARIHRAREMLKNRLEGKDFW